MLRLFFIVMLLMFSALAFCQDCPKDSTHSFYSKLDRASYTYSVRHIKDVRGKCWEVERYFIHLPSGKDVEISKEQYMEAELKSAHEHSWIMHVYFTLPPMYEAECTICHETKSGKSIKDLLALGCKMN